MKTFPLIIASPEGNSFQGEAVTLIVRGIEGDLAVLADHTPFITSLRPGRVKLEIPAHPEDEASQELEIRYANARGGLLSVSKEQVTLLSSSFQWEEENA